MSHLSPIFSPQFCCDAVGNCSKIAGTEFLSTEAVPSFQSTMLGFDCSVINELLTSFSLSTPSIRKTAKLLHSIFTTCRN